MNSGRRSDPDSGDFFTELKDWSEIKLRILDKYLKSYMKIRGGSNPLIFYVDGFAGPGYYENENQEGSPIRTAIFAQSLVTNDRPYRLVCIYTELDRGRYDRLREALSSFSQSIVQVRFGAFLDLLPGIIEDASGKPAIFFLDPFGVKGMSPDDLRPLLQRPDTELILNLNTPRLMKLAGFEDSDAPDAKGKMELVSRMLGEAPYASNPNWLEEWHRVGGDGVRWGEWAAKRYAQCLREAGHYRHFAPHYPVRDKYGGNPKYHLVFVTRSQKAVSVMNDPICQEEDNLFANISISKQTGQQSFFEDVLATQRREQLQWLAEEVHAFGIARRVCCREDIFQHFTVEYFGKFKKMHYRHAVDQLVQIGRARFGPGKKDDSTPITFL